MFSLNTLKPITTVGCRHLSLSHRLAFKFKLTEDAMKDYEERERIKKESKVEPEKALHTKESPLIMARVSHDRYRNIVKCAVPKHRLNEFLLMYIRENDNVQAYDENNITNPGDWVLLRRDESISDENVRHIVDKVVYTYGNYVDPITGRRSCGLYFDDDLQRLEKIKIDI